MNRKCIVCGNPCRQKYCLKCGEVARYNRHRPSDGGYYAGTAALMLGYNSDDEPSRPKRVDWADRPLDVTEATYHVQRGQKRYRSE